MSQYGSATTPVSGTAPLLARTYGLRSVLITMLVLTAGGLACWYFYSRLQQEIATAGHTAEESRQKTQEELGSIKKRQSELDQTNTQSQEESRRRIEQLEGERNKTAAQLAETNQAIAALRSKLSTQSIALDQNKARTTELRYLEERITGDLASLEQESADWAAKTSSLKSNDQGRRIASDSNAIAAFVAITAEDPVDQRKLDMWKQQTKQRFHTYQSLGDEPADVDPRDLDDVRDHAETIEQALHALRNRREALDGLLTSTSAMSPGSDTPTLQAAIEAHQQQLTHRLVQEALHKSSALEAELSGKLADAQKKTREEIAALELEHEQKVRQLAKEARGIELQKTVEAIDAIRQQEHQRRVDRDKRLRREALELRYKAAQPEIERYLIPFITSGHKQLNGDTWAFSDDKVPLSLAGIHASHALENDHLGYQRLHYIAAGRVNDRPKGMFQESIGGPVHDRDIPLVRKAQILLLEFGDLMVEKGVLSQ